MDEQQERAAFEAWHEASGGGMKLGYAVTSEMAEKAFTAWKAGTARKMAGELPWRVGRQVGRTIYDAHDTLIGVMDTREMAALVIKTVNTKQTHSIVAAYYAAKGLPLPANPRVHVDIDARPVEVWRGERKVTVYADSVLRSWGANIETEMSDESRTLESVQAAMDWLYATSTPAPEGERG